MPSTFDDDTEGVPADVEATTASAAGESHTTPPLVSEGVAEKTDDRRFTDVSLTPPQSPEPGAMATPSAASPDIPPAQAPPVRGLNVMGVPTRPPLAPPSQPAGASRFPVDSSGAHVGIPASPATPATPLPAEFGTSQRLSLALSQKLGVEVTALWAACVGGLTSALALLQLAFAAAKMDGKVDWSWDTVLVPLWLFNGLLIIELVFYYLSGATDMFTDALETRAKARKLGLVTVECPEERAAAAAADATQHQQLSASGGSFSGSVRPDGGPPVVTATRPKNLQELHCTACNGSASPSSRASESTPATGSAPSGGTGPQSGSSETRTSAFASVAPPDELPEAELENERKFREAIRCVSRKWSVAMIVIAVCFVIATSLGGRLIGHPTDFTPLVPISFAFIGEAIIFGTRVYEVIAVDLRDFLWLQDGIVEMSDAATRALIFARLSAPFFRVAYYVMLAIQLRTSCAGEAGCEDLIHWMYVSAPIYILIAITVGAIAIRSTAKVRNGVETVAGAIVSAGIEITCLFCFTFSTTTTALRSEGILSWSTGGCFAPLFFMFSFVFILCTMMGCCMAMQTVEVPTGYSEREEDAAQSDGEGGGRSYGDGSAFHGGYGGYGPGYGMPPQSPGYDAYRRAQAQVRGAQYYDHQGHHYAQQQQQHAAVYGASVPVHHRQQQQHHQRQGYGPGYPSPSSHPPREAAYHHA